MTDVLQAIIRRVLCRCLECGSGFSINYQLEENRQSVVCCPFCGSIEGLREDEKDDQPLIEDAHGNIL